MGDLDKLIAAVEAGQWLSVLNVAAKVFPKETPDIGARNCYYWVLDAYRGGGVLPGGLDAALRLHEALLPGYPFPNATTTTDVVIFGVSRPGEGGATGWSKVPSRAWLLAILRALQAQSTPDADTAAIRHHERFGPLDEHGSPLDPRRRG